MKISPPIAILFPTRERPEIATYLPHEVVTMHVPPHYLLKIETTEQVEAMAFQIKRMEAVFEDILDAAMRRHDILIYVKMRHGLDNDILELWKNAQRNYTEVRDRFPKEFDWTQKSDVRPEDAPC